MDAELNFLVSPIADKKTATPNLKHFDTNPDPDLEFDTLWLQILIFVGWQLQKY